MVGEASGYVESYYAQTATPGAVRAPLAADVEVDVCVVGGGLAGLSTALGLAERGQRVVVLEAHRVGWGASGRNGGFVGPGFSVSPKDLIDRVGLDDARRLFDLSRQGVDRVRRWIERHGIDCGPVIEGSLSVSWCDDADEVQRDGDFMAEVFDEPSEFWPRERVRAVLHTERYYDALLRTRNFQIHPLNYARGVAEAVEGAGGRVFEGSAVSAVESTPAGMRVSTGSGLVRARTVVMTCGGYLGRLHGRLARAIVPVATYVVATEPLGQERLRSAIGVPYSISDRRFANDYYRALADTRILWGGRITVRRSRPPDLSGLMLRDLLAVYPQLAGIRVETAWHGLMSYAVHRMPQLGRLEPGLWYGMGFGGHGLNTTAMAGDLLATAIAEGDDRYRLFAPFGLTPTGGPIGAAAAQMTYWWYQFLDARRARRNRGVHE